jgi:hypothetical protein
MLTITSPTKHATLTLWATAGLATARIALWKATVPIGKTATAHAEVLPAAHASKPLPRSSRTPRQTQLNQHILGHCQHMVLVARLTMQALMPVAPMAQEQTFSEMENPMTGAWTSGALSTRTTATTLPAKSHTHWRMMRFPMNHAIPTSMAMAGLAAAKTVRCHMKTASAHAEAWPGARASQVLSSSSRTHSPTLTNQLILELCQHMDQVARLTTQVTVLVKTQSPPMDPPWTGVQISGAS